MNDFEDAIWRELESQLCDVPLTLLDFATRQGIVDRLAPRVAEMIEAAAGCADEPDIAKKVALVTIANSRIAKLENARRCDRCGYTGAPRVENRGECARCGYSPVRSPEQSVRDSERT